MESKKSANEPERPELSDSDIAWLQETIGIEIFRDYKWNSIDYVHAFECYFEKSKKCQLNAQNSDGNTPLHLVAISENYPAIDALLMCGADVNALNNLKQTPVTYSQQYPDYSVGFQFFRHLHKLDFLEQEICKENSDWFCKVRKIYNERYPHHRHIAAFTHSPILDNEIIVNIRAGGEEVIYQMYQRELLKFKHALVKKRPLSQILKLTDRNDIAANRLRELKKYMKCHNFHNNYPLFGFMFKKKYRQSLEHHTLGHDSPTGSPEKSLKAGNTPRVIGMDDANSLQIEIERCIQEFTSPDDTIVGKLIKESKQYNEINQQQDIEAGSFFKRDVTSKEMVNNSNEEGNVLTESSSSNEKLEKLRKMMARLHTR